MNDIVKVIQSRLEKFYNIGFLVRIFKWSLVKEEIKGTSNLCSQLTENLIIEKNHLINEKQHLIFENQSFRNTISNQAIEINRLAILIKECKYQNNRTSFTSQDDQNKESLTESDELILYLENLLHEFSMMLTSSSLEIRVSLPSLGEDPFIHPHEQSFELDCINSPLEEFKSNFLQFITKIESNDFNIEDVKIFELKKDFETLSQIMMIRDRGLKLPALHQHINDVLKRIHSVIKNKPFNQKILKNTTNSGYQVIRLCSLNALHNSIDNIIEMERNMNTLREYLSYHQRGRVEKEDLFLNEILGKAIDSVKEFASNQGIEIKKRGFDKIVHVYVVSRDMIRAFTNILHNAIKYSYPKKYITISIITSISDTQVVVEVTDLGVPIKKEEIQNGSIYQLGFRGEFSIRRKQIGTGIGLTDTKRIIDDHKGAIEVSSEILKYDEGHFSYDKPFITTVKITLPTYIKTYEKANPMG